jgi:hypothetical protein
MPGPVLPLIAYGVGKGAEAFLNQRNQNRADAEEERREALKRILEALTAQAQGSTAPVQPQQGVAGSALSEVNRQLDPLAQQMIAQLFSKILGGGT